MIQLITRGNSQGYLASYVLQSLFSDKEIHTVIDNSYTLSGQDFKYDPEAEAVIILGFPYKPNQEVMTKKALENVANPFTLVLHICSFGDRMEFQYVNSIVDEVKSPVAVMLDFLMQGQSDDFISKVVPLKSQDIDRVRSYVDLGDDYHRYDFSIKRTVDPITFNDFLNFYGEFTYSIIGEKTLAELLESHRTEFKALNVKRENYMKRRLQLAEIKLAGNYLVAILYAEEYPNEIAHWLINQYGKAGMQKIVVLVGDKTKGDDMFRVRTKGAHAGEVAKYLNNGNGKENVGTVFLGNASKHTAEVVINMLSSLP